MIVALLLAALPAQAETLTGMSDSIVACRSPAPIEGTVAALADAGWAPVDGPLSPEITELLIWPQVAVYATGDTGGEELRSIVTLQRKTVAGFARKADIPQSKTRILTRPVGGAREAVLVFWLQPDPATVNIICRFALSSRSLSGYSGADFGVPTVAPTAPSQQFTVTPMNAASLSQKIGAPVTVSGIVETQFSFPSQE